MAEQILLTKRHTLTNNARYPVEEGRKLVKNFDFLEEAPIRHNFEL